MARGHSLYTPSQIITMEHLKAGIITFHRATNYGAVLQAYALQTILLHFNIDAEIIDNRSDRVDSLYSNTRPSISNKNGKITIQSIKSFVSKTIKHKENKLKRIIFDTFINEYLHTSHMFYSDDDLQKEENKYDFFICGSDQIWNLDITNNNGIYFLNFTSSNKKNSYAASLGSICIPECKAEIYQKYLCDFQYLSVREQSSIATINRIYPGEVTCVLDPTLLLSCSLWKNCCKPVNFKKSDRFILFYELYDLKNSSLHNFVIELSKATGFYIVHIGKNKRFKYKNNRIDYIPSPDQWIWLFMNAAYIVTNSFHGTVFSINFHKNFFTGLLIPDKRPANIRINDLLDSLELSDRKIDYNHNFAMDDLLSQKINWTSVDRKINEMKEDSLRFLSKIIAHYQ